MILFAVLMVLMMIAAADHRHARFPAIASCINNYGVGLGEVSSNFRSIYGARQAAVRDRDAARGVWKSSRCWSSRRHRSGVADNGA